MRMLAIAAAATFLLAMMAGCMGGSTTTTTTSRTTTPTTTSTVSHLILLKDNYFENGNRTIGPGTTETFRNDGARSHTVTIHHVGDPPTVVLLNQTLTPGQSTVFVFAGPGEYHVWCRFHGTMTNGMAMRMIVTP